MAHGFSATREQRLDAYADRFRTAGMGVLLFDYRHFGASAGEPRQLLDIGRQQADFRAAVTHARATDWIDPARVALVGSSFSGGHVLIVAARDAQIASVVAQWPLHRRAGDAAHAGRQEHRAVGDRRAARPARRARRPASALRPRRRATRDLRDDDLT
jgi:alpha/beta superfamily hydrolase